MDAVICKTEKCNAEVSAADEYCPECGTRNPFEIDQKRSSTLNRLVILFLVVFFVGMGLFMVYISNSS